VFDPLAYPYVRAQTYVDANPPEVLSDEFYNPTQDGIARLFGSFAGYSTSLVWEEFEVPKLTSAPAVGDAVGLELAVVSNTGGNFDTASTIPVGPNEHGVLQIKGNVAGARGGAPGFVAADAYRYVGTQRWIFHARLRCSNFSVLSNAPPGLVVGLGSLASTLPSWICDAATGFWNTFWDGGITTTTIPTVDGEWVDLWIAVKDADGICRWYLKRDADPLPMLLDSQALVTPSLVDVRRYVQNIVAAGAVAADNIEIDTIAMGVER